MELWLQRAHTSVIWVDAPKSPSVGVMPIYTLAYGLWGCLFPLNSGFQNVLPYVLDICKSDRLKNSMQVFKICISHITKQIVCLFTHLARVLCCPFLTCPCALPIFYCVADLFLISSTGTPSKSENQLTMGVSWLSFVFWLYWRLFSS